MHFSVCQVYGSLLFFDLFFFIISSPCRYSMCIYTLMPWLHWCFLSVHFLTYSVTTPATLLPGMRWPCSFISEDTSASSKKAAPGLAAIQPQQCAQTSVFSAMHPNPTQETSWLSSSRPGRHTRIFALSHTSQAAVFLQYNSPSLPLSSCTGSHLCFLDLLQCLFDFCSHSFFKPIFSTAAGKPGSLHI